MSGESRLCAYHRTLYTETYDGDIRRPHWKANVGKSLGDLVNVWAGSDEGKARTIDVSSLEPYALTKHMVHSSVREFAQRQGTEAQHCRWLREDVADDVTLEELADLACNTSKMAGVRSTRLRVSLQMPSSSWGQSHELNGGSSSVV